jgi:prenyltransferase beta subunit
MKQVTFHGFLTLPPVDTLPPGAFGSHPDHDAHIHPTLSAIQILLIHDALDRLNVPRVVDCELLNFYGRSLIDPFP